MNTVTVKVLLLLESTIVLKMAARSCLLGCITFFDRILIEIRDSSAMHLVKTFLSAIFSVVVDCWNESVEIGYCFQV